MWYPPLFKEVPSRMTVKVTDTYTRHQAVTPTFILNAIIEKFSKIKSILHAQTSPPQSISIKVQDVLKNSNISAFSGFMSPLHLLTGRTVSKIVRDQVAQAGVRRRHCTTARSKAFTDGCVGLLATGALKMREWKIQE